MLLLVASIAGASAFHVSLLPRPETPLAPLRVPQPCLSAAAPTSPGLIKDFMTPTAEAVVLSPDMALREAADLLVSKKLTGAPVVEGGKLVGVRIVKKKPELAMAINRIPRTLFSIPM
jgi:CBS domain-containing protein